MKQIHELEIKNLIRLANEAKDRAYVPYSKFRVGACVKASSGAYYLGCNIENASYTPTSCAERTAMVKAVYEGEREFDAIAVTSDSPNFTFPCGVCRQVLAEFCDPDMPVICANAKGQFTMTTLGELLPNAFLPKDLGV